ncbi:MAG: amidohydrolase family protein [Nocardia sp.]|nr:amidohydrolase family protein [Nocardia sp.]
MITLPDGSTSPLIDASVHIYFQGNRELRDWLPAPHNARGFPDVEMEWYGAPGGEFAPGTILSEGGYPGSEPEAVGRVLFEERGVDVAVLHAMTRGTLPDRNLNTAILNAHNRMLVERWLDSGSYADRYRGTLRVNPEDIDGALREIERFGSHPKIVQIGIPLQSRELYGKPQFWPLWEAAAAANLPVATHIETGSGNAFPPTPNGHTRTYEQYLGFMALNYLYHQMNMIAEGVFERFPDLKFVWADGAADMMTPMMWRMDMFGRPHLEQTPWAPKMPSDYLPGHIYFVQGLLDGPGDVEFADQWLGFTGKEDAVMFGSSYPDWQLDDPARLPSALHPDQREKLLWRNAAGLYGIDIPAAVATAR